MTTVVDVTDAYVRDSAALDPVEATFLGMPGEHVELTDYSPAGHAERVELQRRTLARLDRAPQESSSDRLLADLARERLTARQAVDEMEHLRRLSIIGSPLQAVRTVFELMPRSSVQDWDAMVQRLRAVPTSLRSFRAALDRGLAEGVVAARRQAEACALQASVYGGTANGAPSLGGGLRDAFERTGEQHGARSRGALRDELVTAADAADAAFVELSDYLLRVYAPRAATTDAVGEQRYRRFTRHFTGSRLDLDELYAWGWEEVWSLDRQMQQTASQICPGGTVADAVARLEQDAQRAVHGPEAFRLWAQQIQDEAVEVLDGSHFDVPEPVRHVEVRLAPAGSAAAPYYTQPSQDLSRPGRVWYPTRGRDVFPLWSELSTAYHEGVPGHHLQIGTAVYRHDTLSRFQRTAQVSGHSEGWALYAERLMDELGFLSDPAHRLGYLAAQMLRALRIVIDVGLHTGRPISEREPVHGGRAWTPELAEALLAERTLRPVSFRSSEIVRYLGLPGQAISYKVGERIWLEAREAARHRLGAAFDLAAFHDRALRLGPLGLDLLADQLARPVENEPLAPSDAAW
ncbi:MAG TPA: DUF885 domain-containing protein [Euzebyales bacterium]|nr:DUF885 domain-containing protein [Euzebyales bacterium]